MVMNRWLDHWQTHSFGNWAISLLTNPEKIIGFGGLGIRNYDDIVINNLGYRLSTEAWGKGLATEFAIYAIKFGFDVIKLTEISAVVRENHLASQKVLQKSGLRYVKEIHDVKDAPPSLLYSISVDEWLRNGATKPEHLSTAISALDFSLSDAEITELEVRYLPHPVDGIIPPLPDTPPSLTPPSAIQNY